MKLHKTLSITYTKILDLGRTEDYIHRWSLWLPFGLSMKIHKIVRPDNDRCEHDHPWWFIRFILHGGYKEVIKGKEYNRLPWRPWFFWRIYPCLPSFQHKITKLHKPYNLSFVICGPNRGKWGFITKKGWIHWKKFLNAKKKNVVLWCNDYMARIK